MLAKRSGHKYGNRKVITADGTKFDSLAELHRWSHLQMLQRGGHISDPLRAAGAGVAVRRKARGGRQCSIG